MEKTSGWNYYKAWSRRVSAAMAAGAATFYSDALARRASHIYTCSEIIDVAIMTDGTKRQLGTSGRCRDRMCPLCEWRLALARCGQLTETLRACLASAPKTKAYLATLTIRNCAPENLRTSCKLLLTGWRNLLRQRIAADWQGTMRSLEVTYNEQTQTFHPHLHALIVSDGLDGPACRRGLSAAWARAVGLSYEPIVYFAPAGENPCFEVTKTTHHAAVSAAYIAGLKSKEKLEASLRAKCIPDVVVTEAEALRGLRLTAYGGKLAEIRRALRFGDGEKDEDTAADRLTAEQAAAITTRPNCRTVVRCAWDAAQCAYIEQEQTEGRK